MFGIDLSAKIYLGTKYLLRTFECRAHGTSENISAPFGGNFMSETFRFEQCESYYVWFQFITWFYWSPIFESTTLSTWFFSNVNFMRIQFVFGYWSFSIEIFSTYITLKFLSFMNRINMSFQCVFKFEWLATNRALPAHFIFMDTFDVDFKGSFINHVDIWGGLAKWPFYKINLI